MKCLVVCSVSVLVFFVAQTEELKILSDIKNYFHPTTTTVRPYLSEYERDDDSGESKSQKSSWGGEKDSSEDSSEEKGSFKERHRTTTERVKLFGKHSSTQASFLHNSYSGGKDSKDRPSVTEPALQPSFSNSEDNLFGVTTPENDYDSIVDRPTSFGGSNNQGLGPASTTKTPYSFDNEIDDGNENNHKDNNNNVNQYNINTPSKPSSSFGQLNTQGSRSTSQKNDQSSFNQYGNSYGKNNSQGSQSTSQKNGQSFNQYDNSFGKNNSQGSQSTLQKNGQSFNQYGNSYGKNNSQGSQSTSQKNGQSFNQYDNSYGKNNSQGSQSTLQKNDQSSLNQYDTSSPRGSNSDGAPTTPRTGSRPNNYNPGVLPSYVGNNNGPLTIPTTPKTSDSLPSQYYPGQPLPSGNSSSSFSANNSSYDGISSPSQKNTTQRQRGNPSTQTQSPIGVKQIGEDVDESKIVFPDHPNISTTEEPLNGGPRQRYNEYSDTLRSQGFRQGQTQDLSGYQGKGLQKIPTNSNSSDIGGNIVPGGSGGSDGDSSRSTGERKGKHAAPVPKGGGKAIINTDDKCGPGKKPDELGICRKIAGK